MSTVPMRIVLPPADNDELAIALRQLTRRLGEAGYNDDGYGVGGGYGYGAYYEDDVFMMHPYCWCGSEDCPWCGGCSVDHGDPQHQPGCYRMKVYESLLDRGFKTHPTLGPPHIMYEPNYFEATSAVRKYWCKEMGLEYPRGAAVHCTCGADKEYFERYNACQCDWHLGKGQFRFGPATHAPNFWHKPTDLRVYWYKRIGRSMEVCPGSCDDPAAIVRSLEIRPKQDSAKQDGGGTVRSRNSA